MKTPIDLDAAEADVKARFDVKKAEAVAVEEMMAKGKKAYQLVIADLQRLQGEHDAIQNLRKQAEGPEAPATEEHITSPAPEAGGLPGTGGSPQGAIAKFLQRFKR